MKTAVQAKQIIHNEVRLFANYANERAIPSIVDGLKPSQRKVVACALTENKQLKVSQLGTKAAERYDYKHGEASIIGTAVGLAQTFPGSNNWPLLEAIGQFGNRLSKAAAAPRYIYTKIIPGFHDMFSKEDMAIMDFVMDEGVQLEPKVLLPALPLVLINGAIGTGNGFATSIMLHNPKDIAKAVAQAAAGKRLTPLVPWVKGFTGAVARDAASGQVSFIGKWEKKSANELLITELPPDYYLEKYKTVLNDLIDKGVIRDYDNESDEDNWRFSVSVPRSFWENTPEQINKLLKLTQRDTQNFVLWDENDVLQTFKSAEAIVEHWTKHRMNVLAKRRQHTIDELLVQIGWLTAKQNFIIIWNNESDRFVKMKKEELKAHLKTIGFSEEHIERLLMLRITSLTIDEVSELEADIAKLLKTKEYYEKITPADIISAELKKFA